MRRMGRRLVSEAGGAGELYGSGGVGGTEAPERLFAARRLLLEMGELDSVSRLLSREELLELLPKLGVPEAEQQLIRNEIERA
jgi:hypothetical protein